MLMIPATVASKPMETPGSGTVVSAQYAAYKPLIQRTSAKGQLFQIPSRHRVIEPER